jgi:hypothetical protein
VTALLTLALVGVTAWYVWLTGWLASHASVTAEESQRARLDGMIPPLLVVASTAAFDGTALSLAEERSEILARTITLRLTAQLRNMGSQPAFWTPTREPFDGSWSSDEFVIEPGGELEVCWEGHLKGTEVPRLQAQTLSWEIAVTGPASGVVDRYALTAALRFATLYGDIPWPGQPQLHERRFRPTRAYESPSRTTLRTVVGHRYRPTERSRG